eukprot:scaffold480_cov127-Skeletonema_dohrnii-CCMP3373.AAC.7
MVTTIRSMKSQRFIFIRFLWRRIIAIPSIITRPIRLIVWFGRYIRCTGGTSIPSVFRTAQPDGNSGGNGGNGAEAATSIFFDSFEEVEGGFDGVGDWTGEPLGFGGGVQFEGWGWWMERHGQRSTLLLDF